MFRNYGFCYLLLICSLQRSMGGQTQDGYVWQDDPGKHVQGVTYEKLQEVLQSYPMDRKQMDNYSWTDRFSSTCEKFSGHREAIHKDSLNVDRDKTKTCGTILHNCRELGVNNNGLDFCPSAAKDRRYDYMEVENKYIQDRLYGRNYRACKLENFYPDLTSVCLCECESSHIEADRYFSLFDVVADEDKVVTGVRIKKDNHVFYIQIQQGTLGPNLTIINEPEWQEIDGITTYGLLWEYHSKMNIKNNGDVDVEFYENDMVYTITGEQNTVLLDDLPAGPGNVVTGLRFRQVDKDLRLEIQVTPYSLRSGDTQPLASRWIVPDTVDKSQRQEAKLEHPGVPTERARTTSFSGADQYVRFQPSDFKEDLGQTTVPFIDIQDVVAESPSPLLGVGIFHRGSKNSSGFVAFRGKYI